MARAFFVIPAQRQADARQTPVAKSTKMFRPLSRYGNRCSLSPHVFTGGQAWTGRHPAKSSVSPLCMPSSGDLGFTADAPRVIEV